MNKILMLPDNHGRLFWKEAVEKHKDECDKIILLGDYLDPYQDEGISFEDAIDNFKEIINFKKENNEKVILLIGNHDAHYFLDNFSMSTRYNPFKAKEVKRMFLENIDLFKLAHEEKINDKTYLFTHAGLMKSWCKKHEDVIGNPTVENLNKLSETKKGIIALGDYSFYRGTFGSRSGSILWSDVNEKIDKKSNIDNIIPNDDSIVDGYDYQIFGHTQLRKNEIITDKWACLDCRKAFILNNGGKIYEA